MIHSAYVLPGQAPPDGPDLASSTGFYHWTNFVMSRGDAHPEAGHFAAFHWSDRFNDLEHDLEQLLHSPESDPDLTAVTAQVLAALRARPEGAAEFYATDGEPGGEQGEE